MQSVHRVCRGQVGCARARARVRGEGGGRNLVLGIVSEPVLASFEEELGAVAML